MEPTEQMEYENTENTHTDTATDTMETEQPSQPSGTDENVSGGDTINTIEIENESDSEIFTNSETGTDTSSEIYESSEIADSSEAGTEITTETETASESETENMSETETETADSPESFEIADSSETETATENATETETETEGTLTISDGNPHDDGGTVVSDDSYITDMIAALNGQLDSDRERMSEEHTELMEQLESINTTATLCVGVLLCILLCTGALFGASLARTFWERFKN